MKIRSFFVAITAALIGSAPVNAAVFIMPMGDSVTVGNNGFFDPGGDGNGLSGYRHYLALDIAGASFTVDFVGTNLDGRAGGDNNHQSYGGATISVLETNIGNDGFHNALSTNAADTNIILLHIGTNNANVDSPGNPNTALNNHLFGNGKLLDDIFAAAPAGTHVVLTSIIPILGTGADGGNPSFEDKRTYLNTFNAGMPAKVSSYTPASGGGISYLDMFSVLDGVQLDPSLNADFSDELHPSDLGYQKMATAFFGHLQSQALVPEPASLVLLGLGGLCLLRRRRAA